MTTVQLIVEGNGAAAAVTELAAQEGIALEWQSLEDETTKSLESLTAIALVVGIVAGSLQSAEILYNWYQRWASAPSAERIEKVTLLRPDGVRMRLHNMTLEEITAVIRDYFG